ncbi:MAG: hypothetical protein RL311_598, partial [Bacteroidota bacterium]
MVCKCLYGQLAQINLLALIIKTIKMNLLKKIFFLALFITLSSCKENSFNSDTETYKIEIKKA